MKHAWFRREEFHNLQAMSYHELRMVGRWAIELYEAEEHHAREIEKAKNSG